MHDEGYGLFEAAKEASRFWKTLLLSATLLSR